MVVERLCARRRGEIIGRKPVLAQHDRIGRDLEYARAWADPFPLFLGEFGTLETCAMPDRAAWAARVRSEAERLEIPWCYWDFATDFGAFDRGEGSWREPLKAALLG